jgi:hypothetical protein
MILLLLTIGCERFYTYPEIPVPPPPPPEVSALGMISTRYVEVLEHNGVPTIIESCDSKPFQMILDKSASGGPFLSVQTPEGRLQFRVGEITQDPETLVFSLPLAGPRLFTPVMTIRWVNRQKGIVEATGGPLLASVTLVTGEKESLIAHEGEPCLPRAMGRN